ncbi:MAG: hypothetical protein ACFCVK_01300 [Acidimicrobiales bacterium]
MITSAARAAWVERLAMLNRALMAGWRRITRKANDVPTMVVTHTVSGLAKTRPRSIGSSYNEKLPVSLRKCR